MRTYSEKELLKAVEYACQYQKGCDYHEVGLILLQKGYEPTDHDIKALDILSVPNFLQEEITIEELNNYLDGLV